MVKPPSLTGLMPKLGTQGCRQRGRKRSREAEGGGRRVLYPRGAAVARSRARYAYVMLYAFKLYKSRSVRDECAHESAHTHRRTHTGAHTQAHTHRLTRTRLDTHTDTHFILLFLRFLLFYFTLLLVVFFGFISTYFTLHFSLLPLLLFVFFAFGSSPFPPHKTKGNSCAGSANLCV